MITQELLYAVAYTDNYGYLHTEQLRYRIRLGETDLGYPVEGYYLLQLYAVFPDGHELVFFVAEFQPDGDVEEFLRGRLREVRDEARRRAEELERVLAPLGL